MDYGLATYIAGRETLFTQQLIQLFQAVRLKYPPVPTTATEANNKVITTKVITLPAPPINDGGTIGWITAGIRFPYDQDINLGGPVSGIGYNGIKYTGMLTAISISGLKVTVEITAAPGDPEVFTVLNFFKR